eukprot:364557-Chlamydomonas_euryale.AAC.41
MFFRCADCRLTNGTSRDHRVAAGAGLRLKDARAYEQAAVRRFRGILGRRATQKSTRSGIVPCWTTT